MSDSEMKSFLEERYVRPERSQVVQPQKRFAFFARMSTDEEKQLQDPVTSKAWQRDAALKVIGGAGEIVLEVFDNESRSIPWKRRPEAAKVLELIERREHNFDAIVVGEAKRMFAGQQIDDVYYILAQAGVELWIPNVGKYDDNNPFQKVALALEGILGKAESDTVRTRVRDSMNSIAKSHDKRWMGGNAPYGYKLVALPPESLSTPSAKGFTNTLAIDDDTAPNAKRVFDLFLAGKSLREIARALETDEVLSPKGNPTWTVSTLSTMLRNPVYAGSRLFGKQRKSYVPFDPQDRSMGTVVKRDRHHEIAPVFSPDGVYPAIVSAEDFKRTAALLSERATFDAKAPRARASKALIPLQGRVFCEDRKMEADVIQKSGNIRFRLRGERAKGVPTITLSEQVLQDTVFRWLSGAFAPRNLPGIVEQLSARSPITDAEIARLKAQRAKVEPAIQNLLSRLEQTNDEGIYQKYLQRSAELKTIDFRLRDLEATKVDVKEAALLLAGVGRNIGLVLREASRDRLKVLYERLNLRLDYFPTSHEVKISLMPLEPAANGSGSRGSIPGKARNYATKPTLSDDNPKWGLRQCPWRDSNPQPFP